jgi:PEP-CTERM motif
MRHSASLATSLPIMLALFGAPDAKATPSLCDSVAGNLVGNCGFETTGSWDQNPLDKAGPHTGDYSGFFGNAYFAYSQSISSLSVGQTYNFAAWIFSDDAPSPSMSGTIGATTLFSATTTGSWAEVTGSFIADSASMTLTISQTSCCYGAIDDVSIVAAPPPPVPEPASAALLGLGLAGLAGLRRRR